MRHLAPVSSVLTALVAAALLPATTLTPAVAGVASAPAAGLRATAAAPRAAVSPSAARSGFVLSTTRPGGPGFAPAFVGNGYLAGRQPADGQGFTTVALAGKPDPLPTQSEVHGFFAKVSEPDTGLIERRAALPTWSTLQYDDGSGPYALSRGTVSGYRQSLHLRTGTLTTRLDWTSPAGRTVHLRYDVTPDRAREHAALVRLHIIPRFSGRVSVTDRIEGKGADLTRAAGTGHAGRAQWVDVRSQGLGVSATVASVLSGPGKRVAPPSTGPQSAAHRVRLTVHRGSTYVFTKYVGVAVSTDKGARGTAHRRALAAARSESRVGVARARRSSDAAWAKLWRSDITVSGDATLQRQVRASFFALLASVRADVPWAPSPGGLSSDGYNGHVFWDSETWMYPSMLATEPALAKAMLQYRVDRLAAARRNATRTGFAGARFPWESALSGAEETPSCCLTGKLEVHVSSDIALAVWQYWLATGDKSWLARKGWPVVAGIADFWVSRSHANPDGSRSIDDVIPPDEYAEHVNDSVYTNVAARDSLTIAAQVAKIVGRPARPVWTQVAGKLRVLTDPATGTHPEYQGYPGDTVKQADVTLLSYPWANPQTKAATQTDLDYYVPRTDPNGPSMTDAIHSIVTSALGTPGCAAFTFTKRSVDPFMRGPFAQFSEARTGGAFTFTTGAGGFLQEFLYGYPGLRWRGNGVALDPSLPPQLSAVTLNAVHWRGRVLRVAVHHGSTTVTLRSGAQLPVFVRGVKKVLRHGAPLTVATRDPNSVTTLDLARCHPAVAAPATAEPPQAAVDGAEFSTWLAEAPNVSDTVDLGRQVPLGSVVVTRPPVLAVASTDPGGQAKTGPTDSAGEQVSVSADGQTWTVLGTLAHPAARDEVAGSGQAVRFVRISSLGDATPSHPLVVGELAVHAAGT